MVREPVIVLDHIGIIQSANSAFYRSFQQMEAECCGRALFDLGNGEWDVPALRNLLRQLSQQNGPIENVKLEQTFRDLGQKILVLNASKASFSDGQVVLIVLAIEDQTEQRRTERALAERETQQKLILDTAPALISYVGTDLRYRLANNAYQRWFGMPAQEVIGKSVREFLGDAMFAHLDQLLHQALNGESVTFESEYPGGRTLEVTYTPDFDEDGQVRGFVVLGNDISQRKALELRLRDEERRQSALVALGEQLRSLTTVNALTTAAVEIAGSVLNVTCAGYGRVNDANAAVTIEGGWVQNGEHPCQLSYRFHDLGQPLMDRLRSGELVSVADVALDPATSEQQAYWHSLHCQSLALVPMLDKAGLRALLVLLDQRPRVWIGADLVLLRKIADRTWEAAERARTIAELHQSEEFTRSILQSTPDCVKVVDVQGRLLAMNEGGCRLLEIDDLTPFLHKPWTASWNQMRERADQALQDARNGQTTRFESFCPTVKGTPKWWEIVVSPIRDGSGQTVRILVLSRDISERQQAEQDRDRLTQDLQRSNEDLSQFAHTVAHDLQAPLRGVVNFAQLLQRKADGRLDRDEREFVDQIVQSGRRMQDLVQAVLRFAQVGKGEIEKQAVDMNEVLNLALQTLQLHIDEQRATILRQPLPTVLGDAVQLQQLFQNLISNALKYRRPEVAPAIEIKAIPAIDQQVFSVSDNGQGIAAEHLQLIFEPLQRLHGAEIPGTGLGLTTCQRIVSRHGGRIWTESQPGLGSTFFFSLPSDPGEL